MVEFAIVLPLILMLMIGGAAVGIALIGDYQLTHAATEGAIVGAAEERHDRCAKALAAADAVLGHRPTSQSCTPSRDMIEVRMSQRFPLGVPFVLDHFDVNVSARAEVR